MRSVDGLSGEKEAAQLYVFGFVDETHATTAELLDDAVVRDTLPDHWTEILGL
jgi:hypothetical protein